MSRSIEHYSACEQKALRDLITLLVKRLNPEIIYSIDTSCSTTIDRTTFSKGRGTDLTEFSCTLLIVMPDNSENIYDIDNILAELPNDEKDGFTYNLGDMTIRYHGIKTIFHSISQVKSKLHERNIFFCYAQLCAPVLYENNNAHQLLPPPIAMSESSKIQADYLYWMPRRYKNYMKIKFIAPYWYNYILEFNNQFFSEDEKEE